MFHKNFITQHFVLYFPTLLYIFPCLFIFSHARLYFPMLVYIFPRFVIFSRAQLFFLAIFFLHLFNKKILGFSVETRYKNLFKKHITRSCCTYPLDFENIRNIIILDFSFMSVSINKEKESEDSIKTATNI